jgi:SUN domain-containing protein 1/2
MTKKAITPATTFLMRQRSVEPEPQPTARQATDTTIVAHDNGESYDYAEEEAEFQNMQKPPSKRGNMAAINKRGRISEDNMAYRPSHSDLEEESEEDEDGDKKRTRKKKSKKKEVGGPLNTLPTTTYDKRRKRKGRSAKGGEQEDEEEEEVSDGQNSDHVSSQHQ